MRIMQALLPERPWIWATLAYVLNFAILWMISFVQICSEAGITPRVCEAARPLSQAGVLSMITLAVAFPAMLTSIAALRLRRRSLCVIYMVGVVALTLLTFALYRKDYFIPGEAGCPRCDYVFLGQIGFNMLWVFGVFPLGLVLAYHRATQRRL
jgi:hypothetical protein